MAHSGDVALDGFQRLQKAVADHYKNDMSSSGLTCAWLDQVGMWHMSVCLDHNTYGKNREVIAKAEHHDWIRCLIMLTEEWLNKTVVIVHAPRAHLIDFVLKEKCLAR